MPAFDRHKEGKFSYSDPQTSALEAATAFYTDSFGWQSDDQPMDVEPIPGVGLVSVLADPQGAMFGLIEPEATD